MGVFSEKNICDMGVFSEEENPWNGGQFQSDFQAWEYFIVGSGLPGHKTTLCCRIWLIILILKICNINFLEWSFWRIDFSLHYHDY